MNDNEFGAMVSLLDDPDKEVRQMVESRLRAMGQEALPRLEAYAASQVSADLQDRLSDVIRLLLREQHETALLAWAAEPTPALYTGWLLLSQLAQPDLDVAQVRKEVNRLASRAWLEMRMGMTLPERLVILNRLLFRHEMFRAVQDDLKPDFLLLPNMLEQRSGTPLSLCLLHTLLCRELNLPGGTILLPDYAVVGIHDSRHEIFIDVFNKGAFFVKADLVRFLRENELEEDDQYFEASSVVALIQAAARQLQLACNHTGDARQARYFGGIADSLKNE